MSEVIENSALKVPQLGEYWPGQGGIYAGMMPGEAAKDSYQLIGPGDIPIGVIAGRIATRPYHLIVSEVSAEGLEWGEYGQKIEGANSRIDGAANTKAILAADGDHPAAQWAAQYTKDGHSDFYLPAQREQNLCFATIPDKFETDDWYWTSTQSSATNAWYQYFGGGTQYDASKDYTGRARAVRRLFI